MTGQSLVGTSPMTWHRERAIEPADRRGHAAVVFSDRDRESSGYISLRLPWKLKQKSLEQREESK